MTRRTLAPFDLTVDTTQFERALRNTEEIIISGFCWACMSRLDGRGIVTPIECVMEGKVMGKLSPLLCPDCHERATRPQEHK